MYTSVYIGSARAVPEEGTGSPFVCLPRRLDRLQRVGHRHPITAVDQDEFVLEVRARRHGIAEEVPRQFAMLLEPADREPDVEKRRKDLPKSVVEHDGLGRRDLAQSRITVVLDEERPVRLEVRVLDDQQAVL